MRKVYTTEQKRDLIQQGIELGATLNGKPAMIAGALLDFAQVVTMDNSNRVEYAWATVEHILSNGGTFRS